MTDLQRRVTAIKADYEGCFACGDDNPIGLRMGDFTVTRTTVSAGFSPRPEYCGFAGLLHGGIIATALDEILGWTAILLEGVMVVTAKLEVRYAKRAPAGETYRLTGRLRERRGRRLLLEGECCTAADDVVASASGLFLVAHEVDAALVPSRPGRSAS